MRLEAGLILQHFAAQLARGWRGRPFMGLGVGLKVFLVEVLLATDMTSEQVARGLGSLTAAVC